MSLKTFRWKGLRIALERFVEWRQRNLSDVAFLYILATITGILAGSGAFLLKRMVAIVSNLWVEHFNPDGVNWILLLVPVAGIMLTVVMCRYVLRMPLAHGVVRLMKNISNGVPVLRPALMFYPLIANSVTLGFGGSAGSEGPIAYAGAAIGSNLAKVFGLSSQMMMVMVGCGAGAGIAGIFKSPLGGVMFTLEVLKMPMTTLTVTVLVVTSITAAMTAYVLSGCTLDVPMLGQSAFDYGAFPFVLLLGVFCGFYSVYYSYMTKVVSGFLNGFSNRWFRNITGGFILSLSVFLFPALYGEGYGVVGKIVNGSFDAVLDYGPFGVRGGEWLLIAVAGGVLLIKCFATSATNNGGGVSGDFAPTLFAGCIAGFFFASLVNNVFHQELPVALFACFGMAGVMSGSIRAPLMAIFLTCEMTGTYSFFLQLTLTSAISFGVVRLFTYDSYFSHRLDRNNGLISRVKKRQ